MIVIVQVASIVILKDLSLDICEQTATEVKPGQLLLFCGNELRLVMERSMRRPRVTVEDETLKVNLYERLPLPSLSDTLKNWYYKEARRRIEERADYWSSRMGESYSRLTIKDQKSRWGSCSARRNLNFNWRLIMAPPEVLDYVVIHELAHLRELNHSSRFWEIVAIYDSDFRSHRLWLKKNGRVLFRLLAKDCT